MSSRLKNHSLLLAALLQLLPLVKTVLTHPAAASTWAIVFRWTIGTTAAVGAFDSVSGATSVFTTPSTFSGTVGTPFNANVTVSIGGGNSASSSDYLLVSSSTASSPLLFNNQSTTVTMPPGLTFTASWANGATTIGGVITGTPTIPGSYPTSVTIVSPGNASLSQNITITITGSSGGPVAPGITSAPASTNVIAGHNAVFKVTASGTAPLTYAWSKNNSTLADGGNISGSATATLTVANVAAADAGNYSVTVTNSVGSASSSSAALGVIIPPSLTTPPQNQTVATGGNAAFTVVAGGTAPLTYLWQKNGAALANSAKFSGVATATLAITGATASDAGNFSVVISNAGGSLTSAPAALAVVSAPAITAQPASHTVAVGATVSFSTTAAGSAPLVYSWFKDGQPLADSGNLSGSSSNVLSLVGVTTNDAGNYSVTVSNSLGIATSSNAALTVLVPASITASPTGGTVVAGGSFTFTVAASGSAPLAFQWRKNNANISGANSATLSLVNLSANDAGSYSVTVSNAVGGAASSAATLTVIAPPLILAQPANATVSLGANAAFRVNVTGTAPLTFLWSKDGQPLADGGNLSGSTSNVLTIASVATGDAGNYSVAVVNAAGSTNSGSAALTVIVPPSIVTPPAPVAAIAGTNVSFTVVADGTAPFTFQWQKNGVNISGANTDTLSLANIGTSSAGNFSVVVANSAGAITSAVATLTVLLPPSITTQPANQYGALNSTVTLQVGVTGTAPFSYQWFKAGNPLTDGGNISGANTAALTISALTTNDLDVYAVTVSNDYGSATSSNAAVSMNMAPLILTQPASQKVIRSNAVALTVDVAGSSPFKFQWRRNGANLAGATLPTLTFTNVTTNQGGNYSVVITNVFGRATSAVATLTVFVPPTFTLQASNRWAKTGTTTFFRAAANGTAPFNFQWLKDGSPLADGGNIVGAQSNVLTLANVTTNDAGRYSLTAGNFAGTATSSNALLKVSVPPVIAAQPASQAIVISNAVTFTVAATGLPAPRYQWRKGSVIISGATNASYTIAAVKTNDAGIFSVLVTNYVGGLWSSNAALTVLLPPVFTLQATNRTVTAPASTIFYAAVKGTAPFSYQWLKDGEPLVDDGNISGSLTNVLTIALVSTNDAGNYSLAVTNAAGGIVSSNALLTVRRRSDGEDGDEHDNVMHPVSKTVSVTAKTTATTIAPSAPIITRIQFSGGSVTLNCTGTAGSNYVLQSSADLRSWKNISTNTANAQGIWPVTDALGAPQKFYRLRGN